MHAWKYAQSGSCEQRTKAFLQTGNPPVRQASQVVEGGALAPAQSTDVAHSFAHEPHAQSCSADRRADRPAGNARSQSATHTAPSPASAPLGDHASASSAGELPPSMVGV